MTFVTGPVSSGMAFTVAARIARGKPMAENRRERRAWRFGGCPGDFVHNDSGCRTKRLTRQPLAGRG